MALTREQKESVVSDLSGLLADSKMTVFAAYAGMSVENMQVLRAQAKTDGTTLKVTKNRLFKLAVSKNGDLKNADLSEVTGQLIYAFNSQDEVAPAQALAKFAKKHPELKLVGALDNAGNILSETDVKAFASLPSKQQLRGQLVGTLAAPLTGFVGVMGGNLRGVLYALNARVEAL